MLKKEKWSFWYDLNHLVIFHIDLSAPLSWFLQLMWILMININCRPKQETELQSFTESNMIYFKLKVSEWVLLNSVDSKMYFNTVKCSLHFLWTDELLMCWFFLTFERLSRWICSSLINKWRFFLPLWRRCKTIKLKAKILFYVFLCSASGDSEISDFFILFWFALFLSLQIKTENQ